MCKNHLKNLGLAQWELAEKQGHYAVDVHHPVSGVPLQSWRVTLLTESPDVFPDGNLALKQRSPNLPWNDEANSSALARSPGFYRCPSYFHHVEESDSHASYVALRGSGTIYGSYLPISPSAVTDGLAHTILHCEFPGDSLPWMQPSDGIPDAVWEELSIGTDDTLSHHGGCHVLFADASVKFLSQNIDHEVFCALTTANGAEPQSLLEDF